MHAMDHRQPGDESPRHDFVDVHRVAVTAPLRHGPLVIHGKCLGTEVDFVIHHCRVQTGHAK